ncbi:hypothetical protein LshimejAT787_1002140 [Lyophyllum shimeji]|uniref:F-box domain-containing protein n=1 Tax=Lyophyllum shimeji TaxID=47721 RepID=A0A9P3PU55_LYOSH|nr:hypothetical protein LshimejAT787_1002140 [Lyophyllum shimeji]
MAHVLSLPVDIFLSIFRYTSIPDVLNIRQTCRSLHSITYLRCVWRVLLTTLVKRQNMPIPGLLGRSLNALSATELEQLARKSLHLRLKWTSRSPLPSNKLVIKCGALPGCMAPKFEFLPGRGQRYLLSLSKTHSSRPTFILQCWDMKASPLKCTAERTVHRCGWFAMNQIQGGPVLLAVQSPETELLGIDFAAADPASGFVTISRFPDRTQRLIAVHGAWVASRDELDRLYVWNTEIPDPGAQLELRSYDMPEKTSEVLFQSDVVVVIQVTRLEIFAIQCPGTGKSVIYPVAQHSWQWGLDSVSMAPHTSSVPNQTKYAPINILLRFGSRLPWPVNLIHDFVLRPNPSFDQLQPVTSSNVPYDPVPVLRRQIGSPVRLFSNYHMAVGSRGTAVWIDNHTEDYFGCGDCGQRLAGSLPGVTTAVDWEGDEWHEDSTKVESSMDASVFSYCENDQWTRLAVDEEEGRIAVGYLDGNIVVHEYA